MQPEVNLEIAMNIGIAVTSAIPQEVSIKNFSATLLTNKTIHTVTVK